MFSTNVGVMFSTHPSSLHWPRHPTPKGHLQENFDDDDVDGDTNYNDSDTEMKIMQA